MCLFLWIEYYLLKWQRPIETNFSIESRRVWSNLVTSYSPDSPTITPRSSPTTPKSDSTFPFTQNHLWIINQKAYHWRQSEGQQIHQGEHSIFHTKLHPTQTHPHRQSYKRSPSLCHNLKWTVVALSNLHLQLLSCQW